MYLNYQNNILITSRARPFKSADGHYTCIFIGVLTNELKLIKKLEKAGIYLRENKTEELIIELFKYCTESFLQTLVGSFMVILVDNEKKEILVARDQFGIESLYYQVEQNGITFSSDIRSLTQNNDSKSRELNFEKIAHYFTYGYILEATTPICNVYHVPAGCVLHYHENEISIKPYTQMLVIEGSLQPVVSEALLKEAIQKSVSAYVSYGDEIGLIYEGEKATKIYASIAESIGAQVKVFMPIYTSKKNKNTKKNVVNRIITSNDYWEAAQKLAKVTDSPLANPEYPVHYLLAEIMHKFTDKYLTTEGMNYLFGSEKKSTNKNIFKEKELSKILKNKAVKQIEVIEEYLLATSDLRKKDQIDTVKINTELKGMILLKNRKMMNSFENHAIYPHLDTSVHQLATFLTREEKNDMSLLSKIFANEISSYKLPPSRFSGAHVPLKKWISGDLFERIWELFSSNVAAKYFNVDELFALLSKHKLGFSDKSREIWAVVMFIFWAN